MFLGWGWPELAWHAAWWHLSRAKEWWSITLLTGQWESAVNGEGPATAPVWSRHLLHFRLLRLCCHPSTTPRTLHTGPTTVPVIFCHPRSICIPLVMPFWSGPDHWHSAVYAKHKPVQLFQIHHRIPPILMYPVPNIGPRSFLYFCMRFHSLPMNAGPSTDHPFAFSAPLHHQAEASPSAPCGIWEAYSQVHQLFRVNSPMLVRLQLPQLLQIHNPSMSQGLSWCMKAPCLQLFHLFLLTVY